MVYFVAVILKVILVNILAAVNFANVFLNKKRLENKKTLKTQKNATKIKNVKKLFFTSMPQVATFVQRPGTPHRHNHHTTLLFSW